MTKKSHYAHTVSALVALMLLASGCAKKREAALPEEMQASVFTISEIENSDTPYRIATDAQMSKLSIADTSKAASENGMVAVINAQVPSRLAFMFKGLEISGKPNQTYNVVLSVDKQFVTAYKIAKTSDDLTILEKRLAKSKEEVVLQKQLQKAQNYSETKAMMLKLQEASKTAQTLFTNK